MHAPWGRSSSRGMRFGGTSGKHRTGSFRFMERCRLGMKKDGGLRRPRLVRHLKPARRCGRALTAKVRESRSLLPAHPAKAGAWRSGPGGKATWEKNAGDGAMRRPAMPGGGPHSLASRASRLLPCLCRQPMAPYPDALAMLISLRAEPCAPPAMTGAGPCRPLLAGAGRCLPKAARGWPGGHGRRRQRILPAPRAGHPVLPVHSMPGAFYGRLAGRQLSCRQSACPVACAPRHAATARPDPQGVCAVKGKPARQAFSRIRNFQATLCGQAGIAPGGALLSLWGRFLAGTRQGRRLAALQRAVWQSFGHRRPSSQVSLGRIFS
jgi:hypothetical protein